MHQLRQPVGCSSYLGAAGTRRSRRDARSTGTRRGILMPAWLLCLSLGLLLFAWLMDRAWLQIARWELQTAGEATALAAAHALAHDGWLTSHPDTEALEQQAMLLAMQMAGRHQAAQRPVSFDIHRDLVFNPPLTLLTNPLQKPWSQGVHVSIQLAHTQERGQPIPLWLSQLTGAAWGDVVIETQATLDPHVVGVRPSPGTQIPLLPLAILRQSLDPRRLDTWHQAIILEKGLDRWSWDVKQRQVLAQPDGIRELVLKTEPAPRGGTSPIKAVSLSSASSGATLPAEGEAVASHSPAQNVRVLQMNTLIDSPERERWFRWGCTAEDLGPWGGAFRWWRIETQAEPPLIEEIYYPFDTHERLTSQEVAALQSLVGQVRLWWCYDEDPQQLGQVARTPLSREASDARQVRCHGMVSARIMSVTTQADGTTLIVVQPALYASRCFLTDQHVPAQGLLYRLSLTRRDVSEPLSESELQGVPPGFAQ
ncbi:MAG: hypothetical protein KatS3mg113_0191 [Planctomycetaceae bacterium]|nr:MAG: hypothetical protein KatS3mg113_0191 [Planctomycetaceae bacterium]